MTRMRLTILGGGGFRVPLVYAALLGDRAPGRVDEVRLYDTDQRRLTAIAAVLADQARGVVDAPTVQLCTDLAEAVRGTDFIFSAIRVGGVEGRATDERLARAHGLIGQETVGAGGIGYALRGIPVVVRMAETIKTHAPEAWVINFTNPAGVITEVMTQILGERVVGICDSPVGLGRRVLGTLQQAGLVITDLGRPGLGGSEVFIDYVGLNHLGWLRGLRVDGRDVLPELLSRADLIESFEEGRLFTASWIQSLGAVPNEYLHYYYFSREAYEADLAATQTRGVFLAEQQEGFYGASAAWGSGQAMAAWERTRLEREQTYMATNREAAGSFERDPEDLASGGYDAVAIAIMRAIANDEPADLILNIRNGDTLTDLDEEAVIEVPCHVDAKGPRPHRIEQLPAYARGLVINAKYVERCMIEAGTTGSRSAAVRALAHHPLVDSVQVARALLQDYISTFPDLHYLR